jgi:hypothetical protein
LTARAPVFLDIHHTAVFDVIEAFADRRQRRFAERLLAAQFFDVLPHSSRTSDCVASSWALARHRGTAL